MVGLHFQTDEPSAGRTTPMSALAAALLGACGDDDEQRAAPPSAHKQTATAPAGQASASEEPVVDMNDELKFVPQEITVKAGTRVQWRNVGKIARTVTTTPSKVADRDNVERSFARIVTAYDAQSG